MNIQRDVQAVEGGGIKLSADRAHPLIRDLIYLSDGDMSHLEGLPSSRTNNLTVSNKITRRTKINPSSSRRRRIGYMGAR